MKELKLETISISEEDIIATSSHCTMSSVSYLFSYDVCGAHTTWELTLEVDDVGNPKGNSEMFSYYDEKGISRNEDLSTSNWPDGTGEDFLSGNAMWFHYKDGNFYLCDNHGHRKTYEIPD